MPANKPFISRKWKVVKTRRPEYPKATCLNIVDTDAEYHLCTVFENDSATLEGKEQMRQVANLIAAAPKLLAKLQEIYEAECRAAREVSEDETPPLACEIEALLLGHDLPLTPEG